MAGNEAFKDRLRRSPIGHLSNMTYEDLQGRATTTGDAEQMAVAYLGEWKRRIKKGEVSMNDYLRNDRAQNIASSAMEDLNRLSTVDHGWAVFSSQVMKDMNEFVTADTTKGGSRFDGLKVPLTDTEFSHLGEKHPDMLPSLDDLDSLRTNPGALPPNARDLIKRYTPEPTGEADAGAGADDAGTGEDGAAGEGTDVPPFGETTTIPTKIEDERIINDLAERFGQQGQQLLTAQERIRSQNLEDLGGLFTKRRQETFEQNAPRLAEEAQTGGFLTTSGFGESLSRNLADLEKEQSFNLGKVGVAQGELSAQALQNILGQRQGLETSGLERRFSLEDYERQAELARSLGSETVPEIRANQGKGVISNTLSGAGALGVINPWLAIPGAALGFLSSQEENT